MSTTTLDLALPATEPRRGQYKLRGLFASEWTKLRTVRSTFWAIGLTVVSGVGVSILATAETRAHWKPTSEVGFDPAQTSLIGMAFAQLIIGVLGVLVFSSEYGTGTIRATLTATPRRVGVLISKAAVFAALALIVSEAVSFASFFVGQAFLTHPAIHATLATREALRQVIGAGLYVTMLGLLGVAFGVIIRHTAGAISALVGVVLVLPVIASARPLSLETQLRRLLPDGIGAALTSAHPNPTALSPWVGFGVLCAYVAGLLVIGGALLLRRDA